MHTLDDQQVHCELAGSFWRPASARPNLILTACLGCTLHCASAEYMLCACLESASDNTLQKLVQTCQKRMLEAIRIVK